MQNSGMKAVDEAISKGIDLDGSPIPKKMVDLYKKIMNEENQSRYGFVNFAETWNGRLAMMGILIGLGTELITGQSILRQIGIG